MYHGKVVPWGLEVSGLRCAEEVFVFEARSGGNGFDNDGMVSVDELLFLCTRDVLEEVICVGVARMMSKMHVLVCEDEKLIEFLFESGLWIVLCREDDPSEGNNDVV